MNVNQERRRIRVPAERLVHGVVVETEAEAFRVRLHILLEEGPAQLRLRIERDPKKCAGSDPAGLDLDRNGRALSETRGPTRLTSRLSRCKLEVCARFISAQPWNLAGPAKPGNAQQDRRNQAG